MNLVQLILHKRNGGHHSAEEIRFIIDGLMSGTMESYQMAAWLMAVYFRGMNAEEIDALTQAMLESGDQVDLSSIPGIKVDKHSTGGVGDATTMLVAPIVAAAGGMVAKMSGRGLGHTGGTLDKLESIPGMRVNLTSEEFIAQVQRIGLAVISQTGRLVPADGQMYALRDVTGTVDSIPLIAASIMSKKLACGAEAILLDVKYGDGAFMKELTDARALGQCMVGLGQRRGRQVRAALSSMEHPLGCQIGNALEVDEVLSILRGERKQTNLDIVARQLAQQLLHMADLANSPEEAENAVKRIIDSGQALEKLGQMIEAQGGDRRVTDDPSRLPQSAQKIEVSLGKGGYVSNIHAEQVGVAAMLLGAGRSKKSDAIDPAVGVVLNAKVGDAIQADQPFFVMHVNRTEKVEEVRRLLIEAVSVADTPPPPVQLINEIIGN